MELKELADQLNAASTEIKNAQQKMAEEIKAHGEANAETKAALDGFQSKYDELVEQFKSMDEKLIEMEKEAKRFRTGGDLAERKTLGQLFTSDESYSHIVKSRRGSLDIQKKDISSLIASAGALVRPDRDPTVYRDPNRPTRIRDLIPSVPTSSGSVEVMRRNVFTNEAGPQAYSSPNANVGGGEFAEKNESNITWSLVTYPVRTIAHWVPASRQVLADAPMLANLIDIDLTYGLNLESDFQLLQGDGTNQNVLGLLVDAAVSDVGGLAAGTSAADIPAEMINHIRAAITECQTNEYYNVNGLVLNPIDWGTLETARATDGHYILMQFPANGAQERLWRVPVVVTNAMPQGEFLLGDWTLGARLYEREDISIRVSESHEEYFVKNAVAVLAEERYAFAIPLPKAFTKGNFSVETT